jgi:hypothetical protein
VTLDGKVSVNPKQSARLIRWDHNEVDPEAISLGGDSLPDGTGLKFKEGEPIGIGRGLTIRFQKGGYYPLGVYWVCPVGPAGIDWPRDEATNSPVAVEPHGGQHHYAALATAKLDGTWSAVTDCACPHKALCPP